MIDQRLWRQLSKVVSRYRHLRLGNRLAAVWLTAAFAGLSFLGLNRLLGWYSERIVLGLALITFAVACIVVWLTARGTADLRIIARRVEQHFPELASCLLAAIEIRPDPRSKKYGFLQESVVRQALRHGYANDWYRAIPFSRIILSGLANLASLVVLACVLILVQQHARPMTPEIASAESSPLATKSVDFDVAIEPGGTEVERGTSLLVLARFGTSVPDDVALIYQTLDGQTLQLPMSRSLQDPVFGGRISNIQSSLEYRVEFRDRKSEQFSVSVFEYPRLKRADANLAYPDYTAMSKRTVQDVRNVSAVEGTQLTLICHLNKGVKSAKLMDKQGNAIELTADGDQPAVYRAEWKLQETQRLKLELVDQEGRKNQMPAEFLVQAVPNKPPDLRLMAPARDVQVSPLEELELGANVWDDYGIRRFGVAYAIGGSSADDIVLGDSVDGQKRTDVRHIVALEDLEAEPNHLVSYHFWAEDTGPNGKPRRAVGDIYFAEVRHFDEIFRQGQQAPGGQQRQQQQQQGGQQSGQPAQQLLQLQKEIISATWKLIRRETYDQPTSKFVDDVDVILQSQGDALQQLREMAERASDAEAKKSTNTITKLMLDVMDHLKRAKEGPDVSALHPAVGDEQSVYQELLRLRARESRVTQSQSGGGGGGGGGSSRSQQQLNQLELSNEENRYETQRLAQAENDQRGRETRQVLNRLRELARRQSDLNKQLKEIQSALEEAKTEEEREELRRRLKRLQEEQQEIMRDSDELQTRMEQPENQEQMSDAREQLDQTRQNVRRASEALQEGRVSRAVAAGTRAEREFRELRDEFRKQSSGQFDEKMRQMRQDARQLDESQREIGDRLADLNRPDAPKSLRPDSTREEITQQADSQKRRLDDLLQEMRDTIEEAEQNEPLLAEQLYDTVRETQQHKTQRTLQTLQRVLEAGLMDDARQQQEIAQKRVENLRQGVERAAESILGDETEALRRADRELSDLAEQLNQEIERNLASNDDETSGESGPDEPNANRDIASNEQSDEEAAGRRDGSSQNAEPADRDLAFSDQQRPRSGEPNQNSQRQNQDGSERGNPGQQQNRNSPGNASRDQQTASNGGSRQTESGGPSDSRRQPGSAARGGLGGFQQFLEPRSQPVAPIGGEDFVRWSDRLRDVEEMLDDSQLRAEAARIRDRARGVRIDLKRHSKPPNWNLVRADVSEPLVELRNRISEELIKRTNKRAMVPLDRDPVPPRYAEQVRRYYERLGSGR